MFTFIIYNIRMSVEIRGIQQRQGKTHNHQIINTDIYTRKHEIRTLFLLVHKQKSKDKRQNRKLKWRFVFFGAAYTGVGHLHSSDSAVAPRKDLGPGVLRSRELASRLSRTRGRSIASGNNWGPSSLCLGKVRLQSQTQERG